MYRVPLFTLLIASFTVDYRTTIFGRVFHGTLESKSVFGSNMKREVHDESLSTVPKNIHLALGRSESEMVIVFATEGEAEDHRPYVFYGLAPSNYSIREEGIMESLTYGNPKGMDSLYRVILRDLLPNTTYSYRIQADDDFSSSYEFTTRPFHSNWSPTFVVYGDMGHVQGATSLRRLIYEAEMGNYTAFMHVGDFAYDLHDDGGKRGDAFMQRIQPIAARVPYMVVPGNHEMLLDFTHYRHRFSMPSEFHVWPMQSYELWYSFNAGPAHFIGYSTEVYFNQEGQETLQMEWLKRDLLQAQKDRHVRPWIIAYGHRPMYCSNDNFDDCTSGGSLVRQGLEKLFFDNGVDFIMEAHEHSYERFYPVYKGDLYGCDYLNPKAPVHVISGSAGCNENFGVCADTILGSKGPWSAKRHWLPGLNGYGRLQIVNETHLHWEQVISLNGQLLDSFWIIQHTHGPFIEDTSFKGKKCR